MPRNPTPATVAAAPGKSGPLIEAVGKQLGVGPHMFGSISPPSALPATPRRR